MKKWLFIIFLLPINFLYAQQKTANYGEKTINGYVHFYFDQQYFLVDDTCEYKVFTRVCKYDKNAGGFNGFFTDYYDNNVTALTGTYNQGKKDGDFKGFYPSGKPKFSIFFKDNLPVGNWQYFYPSGALWLSFNCKNNKPLLETYWDTRGRKKVENGKGNYSFKEDVLNYNEFGFTGITYRGKIINGLPENIWLSYLSYPNRADEYIGVEGFRGGKFIGSNYLYPDNFPTTSSMMRFYPKFLANNAEELIYKNCNVDENQGYNVYLQNYLNKRIILGSNADELIVSQFTIEVKVNSFGKSTNITIPTELSTGLGIEIRKALQRISYWIPSFVDGNTIDDTLIIKFSLQKDKAGNCSFGYPAIVRKNGR